MPLFFLLGSIVGGFIAGYVLVLPILWVLTILALMIALSLKPKYGDGLEGLLIGYWWIVIGLGLVSMWGTYLYVTGKLSHLPDILPYIFRQ